VNGAAPPPTGLGETALPVNRANVDNLSSAGHPDDEVNGIHSIYFAANAAGFLLCACRVTPGKRQETDTPPNTD
jgi:hypothetical protein